MIAGVVEVCRGRRCLCRRRRSLPSVRVSVKGDGGGDWDDIEDPEDECIERAVGEDIPTKLYGSAI